MSRTDRLIGVVTGLAGIVLSVYASEQDLAAALILSIASGWLIGLSID